MKVSFDGARRNLAIAYNNLAIAINEMDKKNLESFEITNVYKRLSEVKEIVGAFLAIYDDEVENDFNDLSEIINVW